MTQQREKFLKIEKENREIQRLFGPKAREVFARDWEPYGWRIVGAPARKEAARGPEPKPETVHAAEAGDGEAAAEMAPRRKKKAAAGRDGGEGSVGA